MPEHLARASTRDDQLQAGNCIIGSDAAACELLAAALAACCRDSAKPILHRHDAAALNVTVRWPEDAAEAAIIKLEPAPADTALQVKLERAILRCPVARRLGRAPRIEWQS